MDENNNAQNTPVNSVNFDDPNVLDSILGFYMNIVRNGLLSVIPYAGYLVAILGVIDLATSWWLYDGELKFNVLIQKALKISFLFFLVMNWHGLMQLILRSFGFIGYLAGNHDPAQALSVATSGAQADKFLSPSNIIDLSDKVTDPLYTAIGKSGSGIGSYILFALCWVMIKVGFIFIALQVLLTNVEFAVFTVLSVVLLPFGCLKYTKFLSERCYSGVFTFGIKLMVVYFMLGLIGSLADSMNAVIDNTKDGGMVSATPKIMKAGLAYFTVGYLTWKLPNLISSMMSGQPNLGNDMTPGSMMKNTLGKSYAALSMGAKGYAATRAMWQATGAGAAMAAATAGLTSRSENQNNQNKPNTAGAKNATGSPTGGGDSTGGGVDAVPQAATQTSGGGVALAGINTEAPKAAGGGTGEGAPATTDTGESTGSPATNSSSPADSGTANDDKKATSAEDEHFKGVVGTTKSNAASFAEGAAVVGADFAKGTAKMLGTAVMGKENTQKAGNWINKKANNIASYAGEVKDKALQNSNVQKAISTIDGLKQTKSYLRNASSGLTSFAGDLTKEALKEKATPRSYEKLSQFGSFAKGVAQHTGRFSKLAANALLINTHLMQSYMEGARTNTVTLDSLNRMDYMRENHNYVNPKGIASRNRLGAQLGEDSHSDL